jgi:hypothetical protein
VSLGLVRRKPIYSLRPANVVMQSSEVALRETEFNAVEGSLPENDRPSKGRALPITRLHLDSPLECIFTKDF